MSFVDVTVRWQKKLLHLWPSVSFFKLKVVRVKAEVYLLHVVKVPVGSNVAQCSGYHILQTHTQTYLYKTHFRKQNKENRVYLSHLDSRNRFLGRAGPSDAGLWCIYFTSISELFLVLCNGLRPLQQVRTEAGQALHTQSRSLVEVNPTQSIRLWWKTSIRSWCYLSNQLLQSGNGLSFLVPLRWRRLAVPARQLQALQVQQGLQTFRWNAHM